ncbi:MAG: Ig-like domain-containing protein [Candidatus Sulfotelmatobacter sp.]
MMRRLLLVPVAAGLLLLAGCGGGSSKSDSASTSTTPSGGTATLQSIAINPATATIAEGTTQAFTATGKYSDGSTKDLTAAAQWSCLLPNMATVSSSSPTQGLATGIAPGTVVISASSGSVSNSAQLTVTGTTVTSLAVTPAAVTIGFENQQQYKAIATFSDLSTQDVTSQANWTTSGPFITAYSGLAIGNDVGAMFDVSASFGGQSTAVLTFQPVLNVDLSNLVSVTVLPASPTIANETPITFSATGTFSDGSTRDLTSLATWASSDDTVAANNGALPNVFSAAASGVPASTTITASFGTLSTLTPSTTLTVSDATLESIAVSPANASLAAATKVTYTAVGTFSDGSTQDLSSIVKWSVLGASGAATVSKGIVKGTAAGGITVNATSPPHLGSILGSAAATVSATTLQSIAVTPATAFLQPGGNFTYSAIGTFSDGSTQDISTLTSWSSSTGMATMVSGVATGQGVGTSTITAKSGQISGTASLLVASPAQVSLAVTPATVSVSAGAATQIKVTGTYVDGTTQDFTTLVNWSSSNAATATVGYQTGLVSGLASGTSTITATAGSVTATATVTVQ